MEIPSLVRSRLGDEDIETAVSLGDEDVVCFTRSRTLLYRGEGLLSDEGVDVFSHDVERLDVSEGRRKTKFVLEYVDDTESFTVPGKRAEAVLERLMDGILTTGGVIGDEESIAGVFRFSELTLAVTGARLVKHVGTPVWDSDFEEYPFEDVTELSFEEGSVATQVVLSVDGRPERIKAPNDAAHRVRETLEKALFAYHDVDSLAALNEKLGEDEEESAGTADDIGLSDGISPLVGDENEDEDAGVDADSDAVPNDSGSGTERGGPTGPESERGEPTANAGGEQATAGGAGTATAEQAGTTPEADDGGDGGGSAAGATADERDAPDGDDAGRPTGVDPEEFEELKEQVNLLTRAVKRQNELLEQNRETVQNQQETVEQLIEELRQGR